MALVSGMPVASALDLSIEVTDVSWNSLLFIAPWHAAWDDGDNSFVTKIRGWGGISKNSYATSQFYDTGTYYLPYLGSQYTAGYTEESSIITSGSGTYCVHNIAAFIEPPSTEWDVEEGDWFQSCEYISS
jgi:hypothetical protein